MESTKVGSADSDIAKSHQEKYDDILDKAKNSRDAGGEESDSEDGYPSLDSDITQLNVTEEEMHNIKTNFERRLDIAQLERPGICNIFPREEYKFEHSQDYLDEEERQLKLWKLADKVFKFIRKVQNNKDLSSNYEDKYIKFHYLKPEELHKYTPLDEEEFLKRIQKNRPKYKLLSEDGVGLTYKMWKTNARLVRSILDLHGFHQIGGFECSILWTNTVGKRHMFQGLNDYQWINHFPNSYEITRKMDLFKNFAIMQSKFKKKEYNYCPDTFLLPEEATKFKDHLEKLKEDPDSDKDKLWIVKPNKLSRGRGIYLVKDFESLDTKEPGVVSEYVDNPLTVNGHKFDLRIYVVVTSFYPLKIYVYREGLTRFATERYSKKAAENNLYVHLTNYSINKKNKNFNPKKKMVDDTLPYKWSLTALFHRLQKCGVDVDLIWEQIYDLIIKSILSSEKYISYYTKDNFKKINKSFEIFGYDIMIDDKFKPWLMEINLSPSLSLESNMDIKLKTKLITEMFNLYGFRKLSTATLVPTKADEDSPDEPVSPDKKPKLKVKNYKFVEPELTQEQIDKVVDLIENDSSLSENEKNVMVDLATSPHRDAIIEALSEYTRKEDYIRIFPAKGSKEYFKFFTYNLDVNQKLYEFLYPQD